MPDSTADAATVVREEKKPMGSGPVVGVGSSKPTPKPRKVKADFEVRIPAPSVYHRQYAVGKRFKVGQTITDAHVLEVCEKAGSPLE